MKNINNNNNFPEYYDYNSPRHVGPYNVQTVKKPNIGKKFIIGISLAVVVGVVAAGSFYLTSNGLNTITAPASTEIAEVQSSESAQNFYQLGGEVLPEENSSAVSATVLDVSDIVEKAMPSVVAITNKQIYENYRNGFMGQGSSSQEEVTAGKGSGVIFEETDDAFYIVTNYHVIDGASSLTVTLCDETDVDADIVGLDETYDLAVLRISKSDMGDSANSVYAVELGDSDALEVGESVIAIGNAMGYGQSVTTGVVSALNREASVTNENGESVVRTLLQTDAAINPGNSGGALLDSNGRLIGINEMKYTSTEVEGMCYAIPINQFKEMISNLMNGAGITVPEETPAQGENMQPYAGSEGNYYVPDEETLREWIEQYIM